MGKVFGIDLELHGQLGQTEVGLEILRALLECFQLFEYGGFGLFGRVPVLGGSVPGPARVATEGRVYGPQEPPLPFARTFWAGSPATPPLPQEQGPQYQ